MNEQQIIFADVLITANAANPYKTISETDIKMRYVSNSQEVLRIVPGLFIGQHQGGGKAEQISLCGFDNDHGTDISLNVDGMPINLLHTCTDKVMPIVILSSWKLLKAQLIEKVCMMPLQ